MRKRIWIPFFGIFFLKQAKAAHPDYVRFYETEFTLYQIFCCSIVGWTTGIAIALYC